MKDIRMVDLKGQYEKIKPEVDTAIQSVIDSTAFVNGPEVKAFQSELETYLGTKHVIPCANGTDALQVSMMALDLQPGDEVITIPFTFIATVEVVALLRLKPVFIDVEPGTFNLDPEKLEAAITPKTKAIIPVHLFGQCANMEAIMEIANKHSIYVIEDTCQAIGADYIFKDGSKKKAGTIGQIGCTSFFPSKNLGCYGDGGAIFTDDDKIADRLRIVVNHGMEKRYYHDSVGVNSRLDTIQAAVLRIKLRKLDEYAAARQKAAAFYDKAFENHPRIETPERSSFSTHVFHQYTLKISDLDQFALQQFMNEKGVPAMIYYPVPLHLQEAYAELNHKEGDFPISEELCKLVISLPMHTELEEDQLEHIASSLLEFLDK